jgi:hypothetical protein
MLIIVIGWLFVVALFALAHGSAPGGSWLSALLVLFLIGVLPAVLLGYVTLSRARRRARRQRDSADPDAGSHASGEAGVAPMREEP